MNTIRVLADYNEYNLTSLSRVERLAERIEFERAEEIELDVTGCLVDYYATSNLIDKALQALGETTQRKRLRIKTDFQMGPAPLLNSLLLGSKVLGLTEDRELEMEDLSSKIRPRLMELNTCLEVIVCDLKGVQISTNSIGMCDNEGTHS